MSHKLLDTENARTQRHRVRHLLVLRRLDFIRYLLARAIDEAITRLKARHKTHISVYGKGNERRLTGRHETASVSLPILFETVSGVANVASFDSFRSINSMLVLLIVVHPFVFLVRLAKKNVDIWKIVVQHRTVTHTQSRTSLCEPSVSEKQIPKNNQQQQRQRSPSRNKIDRICTFATTGCLFSYYLRRTVIFSWKFYLSVCICVPTYVMSAI